jgi:phospholipase C
MECDDRKYWSCSTHERGTPGANGIAQASNESLVQLDRLTGNPYSSQIGQPFDLVSGSLTLTTPPQPINNGAIDTRFPVGFNTLVPYDLIADAGLPVTAKTGDIVHRYWHEQSQINHGKMNLFVSWSDNPVERESYPHLVRKSLAEWSRRALGRELPA